MVPRPRHDQGESPLSQSTLMSLDRVKAGEIVELESIQTNGRTAKRLAELGLTREVRISVLRSASSQPVLIMVRGSRLAIDRATARQVIVRACK